MVFPDSSWIPRSAVHCRSCGFAVQIFVDVLCVPLPQLLDLGFTAGELRTAQISAKRLRQAGLSAKERNSGAAGLQSSNQGV